MSTIAEVYMQFPQPLQNWFKTTGLLNHLTFTTTITIHDQAIKIPVISGLSCELTETWMIDLLRLLLPKRQGTFLDVGINLGQTLIKVKALDPHRPYIGFEPNPTCIFYLRELLKQNQFSDCTIFPVGLFTEDSLQSLEFINDTATDSAASLIQNFRPDHVIYNRIFVPVFRFEAMAHLINPTAIALVKIDVEGAELEVVKSLSAVIQQHQPLVLLEVLPVYSRDNQLRLERQTALEQLFRELDYRWFRVEKSANGSFIGLQAMPAIGVHADLTQCDYLVVPAGEVEDFARSSN